MIFCLHVFVVVVVVVVVLGLMQAAGVESGRRQGPTRFYRPTTSRVTLNWSRSSISGFTKTGELRKECRGFLVANLQLHKMAPRTPGDLLLVRRIMSVHCSFSAWFLGNVVLL